MKTPRLSAGFEAVSAKVEDLGLLKAVIGGIIAAAMVASAFGFWLRVVAEEAGAAMPAAVADDSIHDLRVQLDGLQHFVDSSKAARASFTTRRLCAQIPKPKPLMCRGMS